MFKSFSDYHSSCKLVVKFLSVSAFEVSCDNKIDNLCYQMQSPQFTSLMSDPEAMADIIRLQQTYQRLSARAPQLFSGSAGGLPGFMPAGATPSTTGTETTTTTTGTTNTTSTDSTSQQSTGANNASTGGGTQPDIYATLAQQFAQAMATQNQTVSKSSN